MLKGRRATHRSSIALSVPILAFSSTSRRTSGLDLRCQLRAVVNVEGLQNHRNIP